MKPTTTRKKVQKFIGVINYYRNMWPRQSHTLAPLTGLMYIKRKFKWTQVKQDAFDEIKRILVCNTLLTYPDFNETFKMLTDARSFQLGAFVSQKGKPIAFYSRKLIDIQQWYTVTEGKILSTADNLKEFRTILLSV